jgi:hypothetical protein
MFKFKTFAIAVTVLTGIVFALPTSSQAMPQAAPAKIDAASTGNLIQVYHRSYYRYARCSARIHRYYHEHYRPCNDYYPYYGYYRPYYRYYRRPYYAVDPDYVYDYSYDGYYGRPWIGVYIR